MLPNKLLDIRYRPFQLFELITLDVIGIAWLRVDFLEPELPYRRESRPVGCFDVQNVLGGME